jgi:glycosyltransferase involved in cell wall biosynthesis
LDVKTVFLSYAYPPQEAPRAIQVARLVGRLQLRPLVVVCAGNNDHDSAATAANNPSVADIERVSRSFAARAWEFAGRLPIRDWFLVPDAYRPWAEDAARYILRRHALSSHDVLVTFGQPMSDHLAGLMLKRRTNVRWIAHFSDPWVENPFRRDGFFSRRRNARQEQQVIAGADRLIFTSRETEKLVMAKYPPERRRRVHIIGHSFDPSLYPPRRPRLPGAPVLLRHLGNMYGSRTPECLYRPLDLLLRRRPDLTGKFIIEFVGSLGKTITTPGRGTTAGKVLNFRPPVDYLSSLRLMPDADALLVIDAPADVSVFLPSKLIEYIGAGQPIFGITPRGTAADLIMRLGGETVDPRDGDAISSALERWIDCLRLRTFSHPWGAQDVREQFNVDRIAGKMKAVIDELVIQP